MEYKTYLYISCCAHAEFFIRKNYLHSLKQFQPHFNTKYTNFVIYTAFHISTVQNLFKCLLLYCIAVIYYSHS